MDLSNLPRKTLFDILIVFGFEEHLRAVFKEDSIILRERVVAHKDPSVVVVAWQVCIDIDDFDGADIEAYVQAHVDGIRRNDAAKERLDHAEQFFRDMFRILSLSPLIACVRRFLSFNPRYFMEFSPLVMIEDGRRPVGQREMKSRVYLVPSTLPCVLLDFDKTCTRAVLDHIFFSPSDQDRLKDAFAAGCLHEELTRITHFFGPAQNRNIENIDLRGTTMRVRCDDKMIRIDSTRGVDMIMARNLEIANHVLVKTILGIGEEEGDVLLEATSARQRAYETLQIRLVIDNGGTYMMAPRRTAPEAGPRAPRIAWSTRIRNTVAAQQGWQCNICNNMLSSCFDIDHQVPLFKGGADAFENLQALCVPCHRNKSANERRKVNIV
jgi:HNH endonuclease